MSLPALALGDVTVELDRGVLVVYRPGEAIERVPLRGADAASLSIQPGDRGGPALVVSRCGPPIVLVGATAAELELFLDAAEAGR